MALFRRCKVSKENRAMARLFSDLPKGIICNENMHAGLDACRVQKLPQLEGHIFGIGFRGHSAQNAYLPAAPFMALNQ